MSSKKPPTRTAAKNSAPALSAEVAVTRAIDAGCHLVAEDVERIRRAAKQDGELVPRDAELLHRHLVALEGVRKTIEERSRRVTDAYAELSDAELTKMLLAELDARKPKPSDAARLAELIAEKAELERRMAGA